MLKDEIKEIINYLEGSIRDDSYISQVVSKNTFQKLDSTKQVIKFKAVCHITIYFENTGNIKYEAGDYKEEIGNEKGNNLTLSQLNKIIAKYHFRKKEPVQLDLFEAALNDLSKASYYAIRKKKRK